jgi:hypothetical protein
MKAAVVSVSIVAGLSACGNKGGELGQWKPTSGYPWAATACVGTSPNVVCIAPSCVTRGANVYCVGGDSDVTYYDSMSSNGLAAWTSTTPYPLVIENATCVTDGDHIYCLGGEIDDGTGAFAPIAGVYVASLSSSGIGPWMESTPLPLTTVSPVCVANGENVFCFAAPAETSGPAGAPTAYFASVSSGGAVGAWAQTSPPPTAVGGCSVIGEHIYCYAAACPETGIYGDCYTPVYLAPLSTSGIGSWSTTARLPTAWPGASATADSFLYYVAAPSFVATASPSGIVDWATTQDFPNSLVPSTCFSDESRLYCISPGTTDSYFAQIGTADPHSLRIENPPPYSVASYLGPAWTQNGGCLSEVNGVTSGAPCFCYSLDCAYVFDCAATAKSSGGCTTTVESPLDTSYNYQMTIWYPCGDPTDAGANCCFQPSDGYSSPVPGWCISTGPNSFIIAGQGGPIE